MKFQAQVFQSKTGQQITIRVAKVSEAKALRDLKLSYIEGATTLPFFVDEYHNSEADEADLILTYEVKANSILLVAEANGKLVGNLDITGADRRKMAHTGVVGMGIQANWRNQNIGTFLLQSAIKWAKESSILEILWLEVYANNVLGTNLYQKMEFEECGRMNGFFKEADGAKDKVMMMLRV